MKSSSVLPCWASTGRTVLEHQEGELEELGEQLDDEDGGLNLGVDALHHRAPAADLLLLIFSANSCAPCRRLTHLHTTALYDATSSFNRDRKPK